MTGGNLRKNIRPFLAPLALVPLFGCSLFHWGPRAAPEAGPESALRGPARTPAPKPQRLDGQEVTLAISSSAFSSHAAPVTAEELQAKYYYDLGPRTIDVSTYPKEQQENYKVFQRACSQCHTLARPINSPRSDYWSWRYYVFRMRLERPTPGATVYTKEEGKAILDFLVYDSKVRKGEKRDEFEATNEQLQRRFDDILSERYRRPSK